MAEGFPVARAGRKIGLLGGSFDPAHEGHAHITREALKRFGLDEVWWLVSPGNPLKSSGPAPLEKRLAAARSVMKHPRVRVTSLEQKFGTRYTVETLEALIQRYPGVAFVWVMGADNLASFHEWERWRDIFALVAIGVFARPGERISARLSPAALQFRTSRLKASDASTLARSLPPCWCFLNIPMRHDNSSELRADGKWPTG
ncbi:MAG: nicotinate-nucleotide adenylyltransferase [Boseongicola sp.]